jgi:hypothetical protein
VSDTPVLLQTPVVPATDAAATVAPPVVPVGPDVGLWGRVALVALAAFHSRLWIGDPAAGPDDGTWFLHGISLGMHETGHLVFAPFGETMTILGGSLFQVLLPIAFVCEFARRRVPYAAAICAWWVAQNLCDVAIYIADARAEALPLVGGGEHDWAMLLMHWNRLDADVTIGRTVSHVGAVIGILALGAALATVGRPSGRRVNGTALTKLR